jgi:hypothetical protein
MPCVQSLEELIDRCQKVLAHAWMVRTFVKHSEEIDEYPELQGIVRTVFDAARALETQAGDPASYFKMLTKKLSRLKKASAEFAEQVKTASEHTNFKQAVISMNACVEELTYLLEQSKRLSQESGIRGQESTTHVESLDPECRLADMDQQKHEHVSVDRHHLTPDS